MRKEYLYLWYPLTSFIEKDERDINFIVPEKVSPYLELNTKSITYLDNELEKQGIIDIEINPYMRFNGIFQYLLHSEYEEIADTNDDILRKALTNILLHLLGELDLYLGQNKKDIIVKQMTKDIVNGSFGQDMTQMFDIFKKYEKHILVDLLYDTYNSLDILEAFKKAIKKIFKHSIIYDKISSNTNLVIYINLPKTDENVKKVEFIKNLFLPVGLELDVFWEYHFGVIGVDITMMIGEIAVF